MTQRDYELQYGERYKDKKEAKVIPLKYAKAADLSRALNQIKSNIGRIVVDEASNILVLIDTPEKILEMEGFIQKADLVLKTQIFGLDYAQAEKIQPKIQEAVTKGVGSVKIDERTNKIVVTDYPEKIEEIGKIISAFDEKTPQVLIDAQIIEVSPTDNLQMGIDWDYWIKNHFRTTIPFGLTSVIGGIGASMAQNVTSVGDLSAVLSLLRTIGDTKVLSSPRIITLNNQEAKILVGKKDPYVTVTTTQPANGPAVISQNVQTVEWGIKLSVTPTINRDGFITMKIKPEVSTAVDKTVTSGNQTTILPVVSTTEAETTVMVKDGVTIIIGGLKSEKITKNYSEVPILGDIPIIGRLFRKTTNDKIETSDLVILLTPHIITGESAFADFSDIKPKDGYVARMEKGKVVKDKFSTNKQEQSIESIADRRQGKDSEYCRLIISKINHFAQQNAFVGKRGEVSVNFTLSPEGNLIKEPNVVEASEDYLAVLAVGAVKDAAPFPAFPADFEKADKSFQITLEYR
jgi:type II secretory pathway component GspD/PulD (secretin)